MDRGRSYMRTQFGLGVRVRSRVSGQLVSTVGSRAFNLFSACARTFAGQRTDLFSLFAVLYQVRLIAGVRVFRFADIGQTNFSSCVVIRCMVYMGFGFLRANLIFVRYFDLFLFFISGLVILPVFSVVGEEMRKNWRRLRKEWVFPSGMVGPRCRTASWSYIYRLLLSFLVTL